VSRAHRSAIIADMLRDALAGFAPLPLAQLDLPSSVADLASPWLDESAVAELADVLEPVKVAA
jgi:hypothetical protein